MSLKNHLDFQQKTPQSKPIPGREAEMERNSAGGFVFSVDDTTKLDRFLILGTDGGTFYLNEREHTINNLKNILTFLKKDANFVLQRTAKLSQEGRILKNDTAIAVLALAWTNGYRKEVENVFSDIVRIPTHLFMFFSFLKKIEGKVKVGKRLRRTVGNWYNSNNNLVYHLLKYQNREGWTHKDILRIIHIKPGNRFNDELFGFITGKDKMPEHPLVEAFVKLREASTKEEVVKIVNQFNVTWEFIPSQWLNSAKVWEALIPKLPLTALLRNLGRLTSIGLLTNFSSMEREIADRLTNKDAIKKARIHPVQVGIALKVYKSGKGILGNLRWTPSIKIIEALEEMFLMSFSEVEPTNKRHLIGIDGSGSMTWGRVSGIPMTPLEASVLVSLPVVKTEPSSLMMGFDYNYWNVPVSRNSNWEEYLKYFGNGGGTDCSLPFKYAMENKIEVDVFVIFTDNETWYGETHPVQALNKYREKMGINSKLVVGAMTATNYSIADPKDPYQLDVVGFDSNYPALLKEFALL